MRHTRGRGTTATNAYNHGGWHRRLELCHELRLYHRETGPRKSGEPHLSLSLSFILSHARARTHTHTLKRYFSFHAQSLMVYDLRRSVTLMYTKYCFATARTLLGASPSYDMDSVKIAKVLTTTFVNIAREYSTVPTIVPKSQVQFRPGALRHFPLSQSYY